MGRVNIVMGRVEESGGSDVVTKYFAEFGAYQLLVYTLICLSVGFNAVFTLNYVFTSSTVEQRCRVPGCDNSNSSYLEQWVNYTIPKENGALSKCKRYGFVNNSNSEVQSCSTDAFDRGTIVECSEFVYKNDEKTIANEWNISCPDNVWRLTLIGTINNVGQFIAMPLGGYFSDRYGRRIALAASGALCAVLGVIKSFSVNYYMFAIFEFLDAGVGSIVYTTAWIIGVELVNQDKRALSCSIIAICYALGEVLLGVVAKYINDWRNLVRILYAPSIIHLAYFWILPESIKWLLSQNKVDQAGAVLKKAARINGKMISHRSVLRLEEMVPTPAKTDGTEQKNPLKSVFKSKRLCWRIVNCSFCWFTNTLVYYGLSLNSVSLAGDKYINFILTCLVEIPAFIAAGVIISKAGRCRSLCLALLASGISCIMATVMTDGENWTLILFLLGKFAITVSFTVLYIYTAEMFPTNLRQSLLSLCSTIGRLGSMIAPQTILLAHIFPPLPLMLFSGCATISGLFILQLPETANKALPDTIDEAEKIG